MAGQKLSKKILNICIVSVIIVTIIFISIMLVLHYNVNGETNMPFKITKINVISTTDGKDAESQEYKWSIEACQNNDIFIYVEKNDNHSKQEIIKSIKIDDLKILKNSAIGELKFYRPVKKDNFLFENLDENVTNQIEFIGAETDDIGNLKISNQGGVISFRCSNINIGTYLSNDDEQINYEELLKKMQILEENLVAQISFDITMNLNSGKVFKAEDIKLQIPNQDIVNNGVIGKEYENLENVIFKRIEN